MPNPQVPYNSYATTTLLKMTLQPHVYPAAAVEAAHDILKHRAVQPADIRKAQADLAAHEVMVIPPFRPNVVVQAIQEIDTRSLLYFWCIVIGGLYLFGLYGNVQLLRWMIAGDTIEPVTIAMLAQVLLVPVMLFRLFHAETWGWRLCIGYCLLNIADLIYGIQLSGAPTAHLPGLMLQFVLNISLLLFLQQRGVLMWFNTSRKAFFRTSLIICILLLAAIGMVAWLA